MSATDKLDAIGIDIDNLRSLLDIGIGIMMDISGAEENKVEINRVLSLLMVSRDVAAKAHLDLADYPPKVAA
jgi:hypothetical protein